MFKLSEKRLHFLDVSGKIGNGNIKCGRPQGGSNTPRPCTSEWALSTAMMNCTTGLLYPFRRIFASVSGGWVLRPCVRMDFKRRWVTKLGAAFVFPADAGRVGSFCPLSCSLPCLAGVPFAGNFEEKRKKYEKSRGIFHGVSPVCGAGCSCFSRRAGAYDADSGWGRTW